MEIKSIFCWNIKDASNVVSKYNVKSMIMEIRPSMVCLQETKMQKWDERTITTLGMGKNVDWAESPSEGHSSGLLTLWKKDEIQIIEMKSTKNWIEVKGTCVATNSTFVCLNVYAPQHLVGRSSCGGN